MGTKSKKKSKEEITVTVAPVSKVSSSLEGPVVVEGVKHFSPKDLMRYELAQAKLQISIQNIQLKNTEMDRLRLNFERAVASLQQQHAELLVSQRQLEKELKTLQDDIENTYEVKLNEVAYDDVSGRIRILPNKTDVKS